MGRAGASARDWLGQPSTVLALVLVAVGLLFLSLEAQSQTRFYWTGQQVTGTVDGGIVFYRVAGEQYTVDDTAEHVPPDGTHVTVYLDPHDASKALLEQPVKWVDAVGVTIWFVAAGLLLVLAALRRTWDRRQRLLDPRRDVDWGRPHPGNG